MSGYKLVKCNHCGEIFESDEIDSRSFEHPEIYQELKEKGMLFHHQKIGINGFCPKCRKYEIMIKYRRRQRHTDIDDALKDFTKVGGEIADWESWIGNLPKEKGVYAVTRKSDETPNFLPVGTGAFIKDKNGKIKDPNVLIETVAEQWYYSNNKILYIGRVGYDNKPNDRTIQKRVKEYMQFGHNIQKKHWGGRFIWQMEDSGDLEVWYKICDNPEIEESELINKFLPFANIDIPKKRNEKNNEG